MKEEKGKKGYGLRGEKGEGIEEKNKRGDGLKSAQDKGRKKKRHMRALSFFFLSFLKKRKRR